MCFSWHGNRGGTKEKLKEAGVSMYHHNVETTARRYELVCDSHTFEDRLNTN